MSRKKHKQKGAESASTDALKRKSGSIPHNHYDAAGHGRRMQGWYAPSTGPNRSLAGLETLRNRSRDVDRNESAGSANTRVWTTNMVGVGVICRAETSDQEFKAFLTGLWDEWCPNADADGVLNFIAMQTLAVRSWIGSGEVFVRERPRRITDGLDIPVQFEMLEPDMCPQVDFDSWPGMQIGARIRQGIEIDQIGRRNAYWMYREHPGDNISGAVSWADLVRIPAYQVFHLYEPLRPKQLRGAPEKSPVLAKMRSIGNFDDAVLFRQEIANMFSGYIETPERKIQRKESNVAGQPDEWVDALTGDPVIPHDGGSPMVGVETGQFYTLSPGEKVTFSTPPDAGANYADFMRWQHLQVAAGSGTPYELQTGDIVNVSDRSLRIVINEFRRHCEQRQWQRLIPLLQWMRDRWVNAAVLAGRIPVERTREARKVIWSPHAWPYIHPTQDVQARKIEVQEGFRSKDDVIATNYGNDPEKVAQEQAVAIQREQNLKIGPWAPVPNPAPQQTGE